MRRSAAPSIPLLLLLLLLLLTAAVPPALAAPPLVCIDPGHPSETSDGRWSAHGISELEAVWKTALLLEARLAALGFRVIKTKDSMDQLVTNRDRARIANEAGAALMVRLHCDTGRRPGYTLYHPDRQGTKFGVTGPSPEVIRCSGEMAKRLAAGMRESFGDSGPPFLGVRGDSETAVGAKQGALTGSIFCAVPTVVVEMANLPARADAERMKSPEGRAATAEALARGVVVALGQSSPAPGGKPAKGARR